MGAIKAGNMGRSKQLVRPENGVLQSPSALFAEAPFWFDDIQHLANTPVRTSPAGRGFIWVTKKPPA
jgi:hypothetical protein